MKKAFLLKGLCCPGCAGKIENEAGALDGVASAAVNLMAETLTLEVEGRFSGDLPAAVKKIVAAHEPDIIITEYSDTPGSCGCCGDCGADSDSGKNAILKLIVGALVYGGGVVLLRTDLNAFIGLGVLVAAYIILGGEVVAKAVRNITKGRVFDENFLMSVSTIGAFVIGEYPEAVAVMLFYQVGELFQNSAVRRSRKSIAELMDIRPDTATVRRESELLTVAPDTVSVGETIIVKPGEKIPLDGVVASGASTIDAKALTGESMPRAVEKGDTVLSGSINQSGVLTIEVSKTFGESTASRIIDLVENAAARKAPTEKFITTFSRYYTPVVVGLAALLAVLPPLIAGGDWTDWIHRGFVFLVISCPCALVISIPLGFFGGIGGASRKGILVKGSNYLEALAKLDMVVFDKTGTLTKGVFNVTEIIPANGFSESELLECAAYAESLSNHPIAASIRKAYAKPVAEHELSGYSEVPGYGIRVTRNEREILAGNERHMAAASVKFEESDKAGTKVYIAVDNRFAGCIVIADEIKPDAREAISNLKKLGIRKTVMLTGDNARIGQAVAAELGLDEYYAELLPDQKVEKLEALEKQKNPKKKLAFVGDGINDAPVLARADVGIAMGALGSDAAIEAADVVLMTDEPSRLVDAVFIARATRRIVFQNIVFALGVKGLFLILGAAGVAGMWEAVFADMGVAVLAILNAMRVMKA